MGDGLAAFGSVVGILVIMGLIFAGAYYTTKLLGKHYSLQIASSRELKVIDKLTLGRDRYLLIVEAGGKALLLGVSPQNIEALAELDSEAFGDVPPPQEPTDFFALIMNRLKKPDVLD